ncbi:MAG: RsmB/NOP family class I SAM-dependent RNA methyltransferase [Lachnospiraceae bacterium]|nr:RsmB/NOP family class I SAM-dependent RNA methyltransferase [Lachnospiraceae bacterium]
MMNLPNEFLNRMKEYLGDEYEAFLASYEDQEIKALRLNTLAPGDTLGAICSKLNKVPWCEDGYIYEGMEAKTEIHPYNDVVRPGKHPYHEAGAYYIQEPSAMSPVEYLSIEKGDRVLDLCAAPGGKSTQIAGKLKGEGILISNEIMPDRARILSENIERMGVRNALVISEDPRNISDKFAGFFDKVLVDAPCSGEGMFRRSETAVNEWSIDNVKLCADRQEWILDEAATMLRDGGVLVYSTCTFSKEENENQIKDFLVRHTEFELSDMEVYEGMVRGFDNIGIRLFPHKVKGEGHFVCKLLKKIQTSQSENGTQKEEKNKIEKVVKVPPVCGYEPDVTKKDRAELKDMFSFMDETFTDSPCEDTGFINYMEERRLTRFKDQIYLLPKECPSLKGIKVIRPGLHLGTILKNRFEPGHALAKSLKKEEICNYYTVKSDDINAYKYVNGETFNIVEDEIHCKNCKKSNYNGWYVVFFDNFSIGWGKITNNIMKNHYPKGLRKSLK